MRPIQRIISIGFATAALASASLPAISGNAWGEADAQIASVDAGHVEAIRSTRDAIHVALAETVLSTESNRR